MTDSRALLDLPPDAAVAFTDGGVGRRGAGCGMVFVHAGRAHLRGRPLEPDDGSWQAEVAAVRMAIARGLELGLGRLRLVIDRHPVAMLVQGYRPPEPVERQAPLLEALAAAADAGLRVSARVVQGHTETMDLPSRLNDIAHKVSDLSVRTPFADDHAVRDRWLDELCAWDRRFRPTRTPQRWAFESPRVRCAHFLGVDAGTVDALLRAGHLELGEEGIRRPSMARVYEAAQGMKPDAYFGFDDPEGVHGRWDDEISRGWDGRPSKFYHRKSGIRPPPGEEAMIVPRDGNRSEATGSAHA